jgi:hypothetical protein
MGTFNEADERIITLVLEIIHTQYHNIFKEIRKMSIELDNLTTEVARNSADVIALIAKVDTLKGNMGIDPATLVPLTEQLAQNNTALETSINTP